MLVINIILLIALRITFFITLSIQCYNDVHYTIYFSWNCHGRGNSLVRFFPFLLSYTLYICNLWSLDTFGVNFNLHCCGIVAYKPLVLQLFLWHQGSHTRRDFLLNFHVVFIGIFKKRLSVIYSSQRIHPVEFHYNWIITGIVTIGYGSYKISGYFIPTQALCFSNQYF